MSRSGYCAIRSKFLPRKFFMSQFHDLDDFDELHMHLRGDGRTYIVNIQTDGQVAEDIYQAFLYTPKSENQSGFSTIKLPFRDFLLTNQGFVQNDQPELNRIAIRTIGITLNDRKDGDFVLDLQWIKAVNTSPPPFILRNNGTDSGTNIKT